MKLASYETEKNRIIRELEELGYKDNDHYTTEELKWKLSAAKAI